VDGAAKANYARRVLDLLLPDWRSKVAFLRTRSDCVITSARRSGPSSSRT